MGFLKNLLPIAAGLVGSAIPGVGSTLASGLTSAIVGGLGTKKNAKSQQQQYAEALRANRPTQTNPFGTSQWTEGPNGQWSQNVTMNPEDQKRLDAFRQVAMARMNATSGMQMPKGVIDYNAMGLGSLASAAGVGSGSTGKRPWADSPYSSMGGNMLRELQFAQPTQIPSWMNVAASTPQSFEPAPALAPMGRELRRGTPMMRGG